MKTSEEIEMYESGWKRDFKEVARALELNRYLNESKRHLDFGCGYGIFSYLLAKRYKKLIIVGFDRDKERIRIAKKRYRHNNLEYSNKIEGRFDSATILSALHELKGDLINTLRKLKNRLNENGKIIIFDFRKSSKKEFRKLYKKGNFEGIFDDEYKEHNKWTLREFEDIMKKTGFEKIKSKKIDKHWLTFIGK